MHPLFVKVLMRLVVSSTRYNMRDSPGQCRSVCISTRLMCPSSSSTFALSGWDLGNYHFCWLRGWDLICINLTPIISIIRPPVGQARILAISMLHVGLSATSNSAFQFNNILCEVSQARITISSWQDGETNKLKHVKYFYSSSY